MNRVKTTKNKHMSLFAFQRIVSSAASAVTIRPIWNFHCDCSIKKNMKSKLKHKRRKQSARFLCTIQQIIYLKRFTFCQNIDLNFFLYVNQMKNTEKKTEKLFEILTFGAQSNGWSPKCTSAGKLTNRFWFFLFILRTALYRSVKFVKK